MTDSSLSTSTGMKRFYLGLLVTLFVTALVVWFVPGVDDFVEVTFQRYLGRAAT